MEPAAVADLMGWLGFAFGARDAEQGQSFLSKPGDGPNGGGTLLGEKLFPEIITMRSDPVSPEACVHAMGSVTPAERKSFVD